MKSDAVRKYQGIRCSCATCSTPTAARPARSRTSSRGTRSQRSTRWSWPRSVGRASRPARLVYMDRQLELRFKASEPDNAELRHVPGQTLEEAGAYLWLHRVADLVTAAPDPAAYGDEVGLQLRIQ